MTSDLSAVPLIDPPAGEEDHSSTGAPDDDVRGERASNAIRASIDDVAATLRVAAVLSARGRRIDLAGLDGEIGTLCARVVGLPPALGRGARPLLVALLADLDRLREALTPP